MLPLIAVTAGEIIDHAFPWAPVAYGKAHTYTDAVIRAGGVPFLVPLIDDIKSLRRLYEACDGLMFSGGNDIDPMTYNAKPSPHSLKPSPRRDEQEIQLFKWALEDNKPVLGICRGMQLMNVALGGSLYQDIGNDVSAKHNHNGSADQKDFCHLVHKLKINEDSQLAAIMGASSIRTNGLHHQAVCELGKGLVVTARAEDDLIEALELPNKNFVIGVQSHPEALESDTEPQWRKLFEAFVDSAAKR
ncbi:MAG: gamma-glutamyl-gamma-aminobutyrate hydrolase family protein [Patescibacteria group bacterium]